MYVYKKIFLLAIFADIYLFFGILLTKKIKKKTYEIFKLSPFRAVIRELVETEEEFGKDLQMVVDRYVKTIDSDKKVPRVLRDNKDLIFMNFQQIADFHNT